MKQKQKEYCIPFTGLKIGKHHYRFSLDNKFFEKFDYSEIEQAQLEVEVELEKQSTMLVLDFGLKGVAIVPCDRCNEDMAQPIEGHHKLIVRYGDKTGTTDDDIMVIGTNESDLDVSQFIYEYAHLALPSKRVHSTMDECNQDVISTLAKYKVGSDIDEAAETDSDIEPFEDSEEE